MKWTTDHHDSVEVLLIVGAALLAGGLHVVMGPDHLAAVAPLALRDRAAARRTGLAWGVGHAAGAAGLGLIALAIRRIAPVEALAHWAEAMVGALLIVIGLWTLATLGRIRVHTHVHDHSADDRAPHAAKAALTSEDHTHAAAHHDHPHLHVGTVHATDDPAPHLHRRHIHAALGIGSLHGAAGTGHLLGVLPALALPTGLAVVWLVAYGLAAIASMTVFTEGLGRAGGTLGPRALRPTVAASGAVAIVVGLAWLILAWPA